MQDRRQIVALWERGDASALVTLVRVEGSSYRRTGARLLIAANGDAAGSISGGCLEAEVIRKAQWLVRDNTAVVQQYSTLFDDTAEIPYGLGCGGTVDLLIESAQTAEFDALMQALRASLNGDAFVVRSRLPVEGVALRREVRRCTVAEANEDREVAGDEVFEETIFPPQRLIVFGAGNDAQPMVRLAALMGWTGGRGGLSCAVGAARAVSRSG